MRRLGIVVLMTFLPAQAAWADSNDKQNRNQNGNDCNDNQGNCSDDDKIDFRPVICLPESHCHIGER